MGILQVFDKKHRINLCEIFDRKKHLMFRIKTMENYRTVYCGKVNQSNLDKEIFLSGWIKKRRDLGRLIFIDLRDRTGIMQIILDPEIYPEATQIVNQLKPESTITVQGKVIKRKDINKNIPTGEFELQVSKIKIHSISKPLPFQIEEDVHADEALRLKYRYLDMRRNKMHNFVKIRHQVTLLVRNLLSELGFYEIETPILSKSTPEGARDFIVPSRIQPGKFYALPQSPQIYKQLLMSAGMERYFQFARCFRDEDLRSNRQLEFTHIDLELSFVSEKDIQNICEKIIQKIWKEALNIEISLPIQRMSFDSAFESYGSDKPDLRFDMKIHNLSELFKKTEIKFLKNVINGSEKAGGILIKNKKFSRSEIDKWTKKAKDQDANGLLVFKFKEDGSIDSPIAKFLHNNFLNELKDLFGELTTNDTLFIVAGNYNQTWEILGNLRLKLAKELKLTDKNKFEFVWITDWPLLEWSEEDNRFYAKHHPFTQPQPNWKNMDPKKIKARAYDIVCNGEELGGGSIRIHNPKQQFEIFELLGISKKEAEEKFGFLMEAQQYGFPPHGGLAFGFDRLLMQITKTDSINDVIAFPKTTSGKCLMMNSPSRIESKQLKELHLQINNNDK